MFERPSRSPSPEKEQTPKSSRNSTPAKDANEKKYPDASKNQRNNVEGAPNGREPKSDEEEARALSPKDHNPKQGVKTPAEPQDSILRPAPQGEPQNKKTPNDGIETNNEDPESNSEEETNNPPRTPINGSLGTNKEEYVVLMELREQDKRIIKCPEDMGDALRPIICELSTLKEIKPNYPRGVIAFVLHSQEGRKLLNVKNISIDHDTLPVTCRWAKQENFNYGVIKGIIPPRTEDERSRRIQKIMK